MTEALLYRANQVPEKHLHHVPRDDRRHGWSRRASAARPGHLLSVRAAGRTRSTIPAGTEVATLRTETPPATIFTTEADRHRSGRRSVARCVHPAAQRWRDDGLGGARHAPARSRGETVIMFPDPPSIGDAFLIAFENGSQPSRAATSCGCEHAGGAGVNPDDPPLQLGGLAGRAGALGAVRCSSTTPPAASTATARSSLRLPAMAEHELGGRHGFWLRCVVDQGRATATT